MTDPDPFPGPRPRGAGPMRLLSGRLRPRTRLVQKPYSLTMLVESLKEMLDSPKLPQD